MGTLLSVRIVSLRKLLTFLLGIKRAYFLFNRQIETDVRLDDLFKECVSLGLTKGFIGDPTIHIGTAICLLQDYKIELHGGLSYGDCRAVLDRNNWTSKISGPLIGRFFVDENPDDVDYICAFGPSANEAICKCLIAARIAGVI